LEEYSNIETNINDLTTEKLKLENNNKILLDKLTISKTKIIQNNKNMKILYDDTTKKMLKKLDFKKMKNAVIDKYNTCNNPLLIKAYVDEIAEYDNKIKKISNTIENQNLRVKKCRRCSCKKYQFYEFVYARGK